MGGQVRLTVLSQALEPRLIVPIRKRTSVFCVLTMGDHPLILDLERIMTHNVCWKQAIMLNSSLILYSLKKKLFLICAEATEKK